MQYLVYSPLLLSVLIQVSQAIQCFSCLSNEAAGKFCRKVSEAQIITCPNDATWCNALVFLKNGKVNVNRGCSGSVSSWGFGRSECDIMSAEPLMDVGVAFYQCRGDACNNIEPADGAPTKSDVVLLTKTVEEETHYRPAPAPKAQTDDDEESYGPRRTTTTTTQKRVNTTPRSYPEESTEETTEKPKVITPAPVVTSPRARTTPAPVEETTEETESPYQPRVTTKATPAPATTAPRARTPAPYPQDSTELKEEEDTEAPSYKPAPKTTTTTTTTTTTKRRRPDYGATELIDTGVTEVKFRPTARRRVAFDRR
ncbi:proteoglycan 4-like [Paramacrobiotus metropolitanus]|uniref:proteoglycan 4-like n=1 Tax=Paramacrobiotus metropolitanus TaxID=2943436 RepID=UPI00244590E3|nr:proteoglycan 4-like [Paramacrobiotus metropolitanus]